VTTLGYEELAPPVANAPTARPPLLMLHGFTQTRRSWGRFAEVLGRERALVLVDLPGHGQSSEVRADPWVTAELVLEVARTDATARQRDATARVDLLGYSLGARLALHVALSHPEAVRRLTLVSATAGIEDEEARQERRRRDAQLADELEAGGDVAGFVRRWLAAPMFATLRDDSSNMDSRLTNTAAGLASSLRLTGAGAQEPLWSRLGTLEPPLLAVAGATDPRYVGLARRMVQAVPAGTLSVVPGAGHAVHLEQPELTARVVDGWLSAVDAVAA
jgi:2-succinyl-6-hydroxy-2,4-cyclohexadiene-1-carboxylate synthase